ncbi:MAG TPA: group II intron reverse transcriptase/maturase [Candidatus Acidoferrales bacterium]|jgi:RNA-directed DNA polymerase|nr:group II intron reverse transcriptase/maturase [Candidatus Acidoferrales bacterium]
MASITVQDLRRRLYTKAKSDPTWRFWGLYVHICKLEILREAYAVAKANDGAPGSDGVTFQAIEAAGVERFLAQLRDALVSGSYRPLLTRKHAISKRGGGERILQIPAIQDRIVQGALKLMLEPIFEADFQPGSHGYRPKRTAHRAVMRVAEAIAERKTRVVDLDLQAFFDNVHHQVLLEQVARRVSDPAILHLLKLILKATGRRGLPQGGPLSPLLSNIYLTPVDQMLEKAQEVTREGSYRRVTYARWADDLVILVDAFRRYDWLLKAVNRRVREELAKLGIPVNEEKSQVLDLERGETFTFLGFEFSRVRSHRGVWRPQFTPARHKRAELRQKLREVFRHHRSQPVYGLIAEVNPILAGWLNYFRIGHAGWQFASLRRWVEMKMRRHLARAAKRPGFGWKRWSTEWLYRRLGLYRDYGIRYAERLPKALPAR